MASTQCLSACLLLFLTLSNADQDIYQSKVIASNAGLQFTPVNYDAQLLSVFVDARNAFRLCLTECNRNPLCRVFDVGSVELNQCRLFQGDMLLHGTMIASSNANSRVGTLQFASALYPNYGQPCNAQSTRNRYLTCGQSLTWECPPYAYWNAAQSMCLAQSPILGSVCQQNLGQCRADLNYTCLQFNQCGPLSLLLGTTLLDQNTVIEGSSTIGLSYPYGVIVNGTADHSIAVINCNRQQAIRFQDYGSSIGNVSLVAQNWTGGNNFGTPFGIAIHPNQNMNLYVSGFTRNCVFKVSNMQVVSPIPTVIAGTCGTGGSAINLLNQPSGIAIDNQSRVIIADTMNHRIVRWSQNSSAGTIIAGLGVANGDSFSLNTPLGVFLDEPNAYIYVSDTSNNRIQRFSLLHSMPNNGTTVAGGNGPGTNSNQLNSPFAVHVSRKTGALYIADSHNHRIQRWNPGDPSAVTVAGDPDGATGTNARLLNYPYGVAMNYEETLLYVVDSGNSRIQRFQLV